MKNNILIAGFNSSFGKSITSYLSEDGYNLSLLSRKIKDQDREFINKINNDNNINTQEFDIIKGENFNYEEPVYGLVYCVSSPVSNKSFYDLDWSDFDNHIKIQIKGLIDIIKGLDKKSLRRVVVIGSSYTLSKPPSRVCDYVTSKYALLGLVKTLAVELARHDITVNMVSPGVSGEGISSEMFDVAIEMEKKSTPMNRLVRGDDVANVVGFLLKEESSYLTGLNILVDGGKNL